jgi:hypothetical protein
MYWFGPPFRDYPNFNLPMGRSLGFASTPLALRPIQTRFRFAFVAEQLKLASEGVTRRLIMQKARRHPLGLRPLVGVRFQVLFTPFLGSFHLSLTVLVHYRSLRSI